MLEKEVRRKISRREWEFLWDTCQMEYIWKFYQGILDRKPKQTEFNSCYERIKDSTDKLATAKAIAIELVRSPEFQDKIRPSRSCKKIVAGFLTAILNGKYTEDDYKYYINYCKSDDKSQQVCEDIVEKLLSFKGVKNEVSAIQQSLGEIKYYLLKDKKYYLAQQIADMERIIAKFKEEIVKNGR